MNTQNKWDWIRIFGFITKKEVSGIGLASARKPIGFPDGIFLFLYPYNSLGPFVFY